MTPAQGILLVLLGLPATVAFAEKTQTTSYDRIVWGEILASHAADFSLTEECIKRPYRQCHEAVLGPIPQNKVGFGALELGFSAGQIGVSKVLRRHKHIRLARAWDLANLTGFGAIDLYVYKLAK